jgi:carbonic anhydrase
VAGNVSGNDEIASIEYGVEHLNIPLLVVLGHTECGAVTAAVNNSKVEGRIPMLLQKIKPAADRARSGNKSLKGKDLINEAIKENVYNSMSDILRNSEIVRELVTQGNLAVEGAVYDIKEGRIIWLGPHPDQDKLVK